MSVISPTAVSYLDMLLDEICRQLQLTAAQYREAKEKYKAVTDWLSRNGSPLAQVELRIFPQGSVRIGTTVKPRLSDEHDVDLVLVLGIATDDAMAVYRVVRDRLADHGVYRKLLEEKNRCLRLNYAGQFHLDILPARPDPDAGGTCILIPDKEMQDWSQSDPEGFADWFLSTARAVYEKTDRETEPLPEPEDADSKTPLQRAVQLMKRRRDIYFDGDGDDDDAPRSIILTTLAARQYQGEEHTVLGTLQTVLDGVSADIESTTGILDVPNPTRPEENFAEAWTDSSYEKFAAYIHDFKVELTELQSLEGLDMVGAKLEEMFGEELARLAAEATGERLRQAREAGTLRVGKTGLATASVTGTVKVPKHTFYGHGA